MTEALQESRIRQQLASARRVVIKLGSSLLTNRQTGLEQARIEALADEVHALLDAGREVVLVSSGAVAEGCARMGFETRPTVLQDLQAAAAVGQVGLIAAYERAFLRGNRHAAMVLLTHDDFADRERYLNARATLSRLLALGVVPVINENDTVANDEIRFGDNDTLAGLVTNLIQAEVCILLTDTEGLRKEDPRSNPDAELVRFSRADDPALRAMAGPSGAFGRGGMVTKVKTARLAMRSGAHTIIADGRTPGTVTAVLAGQTIGTLLAATVRPMDARKRWIAGHMRPRGDVQVDAGAVRALGAGRSLLSVGVTAVRGEFRRGEVVRLLDASGGVLGQGLVNYPSDEAGKLIGVASGDMHARLGYMNEPELVHRDNLVLFEGE